MSGIRVDEDLLPSTLFAIHLTKLGAPAGWLVGQFSLEEMWRTVDRIKIGAHGYALVARRRTASWSRTATPTGRRSSRRRRT